MFLGWTPLFLDTSAPSLKVLKTIDIALCFSNRVVSPRPKVLTCSYEDTALLLHPRERAVSYFGSMLST